MTINALDKTTDPGNCVWEIHHQHYDSPNAGGGWSTRFVEVPDTKEGYEQATLAALEDVYAYYTEEMLAVEPEARLTNSFKHPSWESLKKNRDVRGPLNGNKMRGPKRHGVMEDLLEAWEENFG